MSEVLKAGARVIGNKGYLWGWVALVRKEEVVVVVVGVVVAVVVSEINMINVSNLMLRTNSPSQRICGYEQTCLPVVLSRLSLLGFPRAKSGRNEPQGPPRRTSFLMRARCRRSGAAGKVTQCSNIFYRVNGIRVVLPKGLLPAVESSQVPF